MIRAEFLKDGDRLSAFRISGHSGYADAGSDIVCAAVSSASQLVCNTITEHYNDKADVEVGDNVLSLKLREASDASFILIGALYEHLVILSEDYPDTISVTIKRR